MGVIKQTYFIPGLTRGLRYPLLWERPALGPRPMTREVRCLTAN